MTAWGGGDGEGGGNRVQNLGEGDICTPVADSC